jgi:hypothetical protein
MHLWPASSLHAVAAFSLLAVAAFSAAARSDQLLFDFDKGFDFAAVEARDAKVTESKGDAGSALRMQTAHHDPWPGITLKAPDGHWDLSAWRQVALDVTNVGTNDVTVSCRVDNPGADGRQNCVTASVSLKPGEAKGLTVDLPPTVKGPDGKPLQLFGMRGYPFPTTIDPRNVTQILVFVPRPTADHLFDIRNIRAAGARGEGDVPEQFLPFIDEFGQYIHKDWPGKTHSLDELGVHRSAEAKDLDDHPGPTDWDRYGGWQGGPQLEATGHFRTEKYQGKWWLVDPDGRLFFSHGIDCVTTDGSSPISERESWFRWLPPRDSEFRAFYSTSRGLHGHYAGRTMDCFDFGRANLLRKYGPDWPAAFAEISHRRLRSWGLNTIANWSDSSIYLMRQTPYVVSINFRGRLLEGSEGYWGKFRDVFDASFEEQVRASMARQAGRSAGDPWCIGYFVDNEIAWGDEVSLAVAALASPADQPAKRAFVEDLQAKYGTIQKLNEKWDTGHASWEALLQHQGPPDLERAREDLTAFYTRTAERYFETCRNAVKEVAPDNLYLGCRFAWVNPLAVAAAAKYCDVVSYNIYRRSAADFKLPVDADVPLIIGEFHFGALDRGMFHTGLVAVADQAERADVYREYVRGVLRHPQFVGCHWFKYMDEPTTGRPLDEENYQIGFVDIADTPYPETIQASRDVGYAMYRYRLEAK